MKKTKLSIALFIIMLFTALACTACVDKNVVDGAKLIENTQKLVVIEATETGGSLEDALKSFSQAGNIELEGSTNEFGFFITSINGYAPDASKNEFWAIYSSLGEYEGVSYSNAEYGTYEYNGVTYASASYGVSGMPLIKGEIYILTISTF